MTTHTNTTITVELKNTLLDINEEILEIQEFQDTHTNIASVRKGGRAKARGIRAKSYRANKHSVAAAYYKETRRIDDMLINLRRG